MGLGLKSVDGLVGGLRTGDGDFDGELGVAEDAEHGGDAGEGVGDDDGGAGVVSGFDARDDEDPGADDRTDAEPQEVPPGQVALHGRAAARLHGRHFLRHHGAREHPVAQPRGRGAQGALVVPPALERLLRQP
jgi:hypothetical protein